ncbi:MAG: sigma-70 family RNA polymerase sigma factor [Bryobacteraceae bacterium]
MFGADSIPENIEKTISALARGFARPGVEADDLAQEARLTFLRSKSGFDPNRGASLSTYAYPRIQGAMLSHIRAEARRQASTVGLDDLPADPPSPVESPEGILLGRLDAGSLRMLQRRVADLPRLQRKIVRRRYWQGQTFEAIGAALRLSCVTTWKQHQHALSTLRRRFGEA